MKVNSIGLMGGWSWKDVRQCRRYAFSGRRCVLVLRDIKLDNGDQTAMFSFEWILKKNHAFDTCDANFGTWDELRQQMFVCGGLLRFYRLFEMSLLPSALIEESTTRALKYVISFHTDFMRNYASDARQRVEAHNTRPNYS